MYIIKIKYKLNRINKKLIKYNIEIDWRLIKLNIVKKWGNIYKINIINIENKGIENRDNMLFKLIRL
jgi:hypothetical protein